MTTNTPDYLRRYDGNLSWMATGTIYAVRAGSHAYGMATETSDLDIRGIVIPPKSYCLGLDVFEQAQWKPDPMTEVVQFNLRKFAHLAADGNPNVVELLFVEPTDIFVDTEAGEALRGIRDAFISKKMKHTFSGYAMSQLQRIQTHRRWLIDPPKAKPTRADFGLPETTLIPGDQLAAAAAAVQKRLDQWEPDMDGIDPATRERLMEHLRETLTEMKLGTVDERWESAARSIGLADNLIEVMRQERQYTTALRNFQQYQQWKANRNPARAAMEAESGFDRKHASHLVRLMRMCREILAGEGLKVRRPDAEELLAIRRGAWTYDELVEWAKRQDAELDEVAKRSTLPRSADMRRINATLIDVTDRWMRVHDAT